MSAPPRCDDLLQRIPSGQLTVLVFCEGEQLNLFRVVENVDGTYSPVTDPLLNPPKRYENFLAVHTCLLALKFIDVCVILQS